jgi:O-antigen ligase
MTPRPGFDRYLVFAATVTVLGYSLGYSTIGLGLLLAGTLWGLARDRRFPWVHTSLDLPLAVFGAVVLAAAAMSPYHDVAAPVTFMLLVSGAVYLGPFAWLLAAAPGVRERLLRAWAAGAVLAAAVGLAYGIASTSALPQGRIEIPLGVGPNGLGTTLMFGGIVSLALVFHPAHRQRWAWVAGGLLCLAGLLASGSRASLLGWLAAAAYLIWRELSGRPRRMLVVGAAGLCLLAVIAALSPQMTRRLPSTLTDLSGNRLRIWHTSIGMIGARPVLGTGFGTFERAYDRRRAPGMSPEPFAFNLWLNLAVETGFLGLAAALWVAVEAVRAWRRRWGTEGAGRRDSWRVGIVALWIGLLVDQFADNTLFSVSTSAVLWLLLALTAVPSAPSTEAVFPAQQIAPPPGR